MIRRKADFRQEIKNGLKGGNGELEFNYFLEETEAQGTGRLFSFTRLDPGSSIGYHKHEGEIEIFYILSGTATVCDNGRNEVLLPGDSHTCFDCDSHSIENTGTDLLEILALVLYTKDLS